MGMGTASHKEVPKREEKTMGKKKKKKIVFRIGSKFRSQRKGKSRKTCSAEFITAEKIQGVMKRF